MSTFCREDHTLDFHRQDKIGFSSPTSLQTRPTASTKMGTNEPIEISNTSFFDQCLGWRGICFSSLAEVTLYMHT